MLRFATRYLARIHAAIATVCLLFAAAGCSEEIRFPAAAEDTGASKRGPKPVRADSQKQAIPATADAAVMAALQGLSANHPDALWDVLPQSYQKDLDELVSTFATRLHPEAWRWFAQIAGKSRGLLPAYDTESANREPAKRLLEWLASGTPGDLKALRRADLGGFLRTRGRTIMADVRLLLAPLVKDPEFDKALRDLLGPVPDVFLDPSLLKLKVKDLDGDRCVLEVQLPVDAEVLAELYRFDVAFVRVDGKWIPEWLAENWSDLIGESGDVLAYILDILPSERAEDNFGFVFRYLGQLETMIDFELASARGETIPPPTLYDVIDYLRALAEDLELPLPEPLRAPDPDDAVPPEAIETEASEPEQMQTEPQEAEPGASTSERKPSNE